MKWSDRQARNLRAQHKKWAEENNLPCARCNKPIWYQAPKGHRWAYECGHKHPVSTHPHLMLDWNNLQPEHLTCNRSAGARPQPFKTPHNTTHSPGWPT